MFLRCSTTEGCHEKTKALLSYDGTMSSVLSSFRHFYLKVAIDIILLHFMRSVNIRVSVDFFNSVTHYNC